MPGDIPASTPASDALSADLRRRGLRFVGSTIVYAFMQSVGLVDDHLPGCFRYAGSGLTGYRSRRSNHQPATPSTSADPDDRPGDERERRRRRRVERVRLGESGRPAGREEHDERRLEAVDDAAPQAVARQDPAAHLGDAAEQLDAERPPPRRPSRRPSSRARSRRRRSPPRRSTAGPSRARGSASAGRAPAPARNADGQDGLRRTVARDDERRRAIASSPDSDRVGHDHDGAAEPAPERGPRHVGSVGPGWRSATPDSRSPPIAGAPTKAAVIASTKLNMNAIRIRTCETPIRISSSSDAVRPGEGDQPFEAPADERDRDDRQRGQDPDDPAADELADREPGDDDHGRSSAGGAPATSSRKRASSEPRPGSTAWTRPPAATIAATRSGIRSRSSVRDRQPLPVDARPGRTPARAPRPASSRSVTRTPNAVAGHDLVERAGGDRPALVEDHDAVADPLDLGQQVRVEDHGRAAIARRPDDGADVGPADRVERRRRLVEQDQLGLAQERHAEPEPLLHALREAADRVVGPVGQPDELEGVVDGAAPRAAGGIRASSAWSAQHLAGAQPRLVAEELGQVPDPAPGRRGRRAARPGRARCPRVGRARPSSSLIAVVLPAPFGPSSPTSSPRPDAKAQAVERGRPAVGLDDAVELDRRALTR